MRLFIMDKQQKKDALDIAQAKSNIATRKREIAQSVLFSKDELTTLAKTSKPRGSGISTISVIDKDAFKRVHSATGSPQVRLCLETIARLCTENKGSCTYDEFYADWEDNKRHGYDQDGFEVFGHYWNVSGGKATLVKSTKLTEDVINQALAFNS